MNKRQMKLSRKEEEMMAAVKSKMRYAGETYHRVAAPEMEISKLYRHSYLLYRYAQSEEEAAGWSG